MCIGEGALDTIGPHEQEQLRLAAGAAMPTHSFAIHANGEGTRWIVLEPQPSLGLGLRFTICRIAPSVVVMVEAPSGRRQFCSFDGIDGVMAFARSATADIVLAGAHTAPSMQQ